MNSFYIYKSIVGNVFSKNFSFGTTKKQKTKILSFVGFITLLLVGFGPICMLYGYSMQQISQTYGNKYVYEILACALFAVTILMSLVSTYNSLYNSTDVKILISLPLKDKTLFRVRTLQSLTLNTLFVLFFMVIATIGTSFDIGWIIYSLVGFVTTVILSTMLCTIVSYVLRLIAKNNKWVKILLTSIFVVSIAVFYFFFILNNNKKDYSVTLDQAIPLITNLKFIAFSGENIFYLLIYIILTAFLYLLIENIVGRNYTKLLYVYDNITAKKILKKDKNYRGLKFEMLKREFDIIHGEKSFMIECYSSLFLPALMVFIILINGQFRETGFIGQLIMSVVLIFTNTGNVASLMFSREGKTFSIIKTLPIKANDYLQIKQLTSLLFGLPIGVISLLITATILRINVLFTLASIFIYLIGFITTSTIDLSIDAIKPKFNWDNAAQLQKRSLKAMVGIIVTLAYIVVAFAPAILILIFFNLKLLAIIIGLSEIIGLFIATQVIYYKKGNLILKVKP